MPLYSRPDLLSNSELCFVFWPHHTQDPTSLLIFEHRSQLKRYNNPLGYANWIRYWAPLAYSPCFVDLCFLILMNRCLYFVALQKCLHCLSVDHISSVSPIFLTRWNHTKYNLQRHSFFINTFHYVSDKLNRFAVVSGKDSWHICLITPPLLLLWLLHRMNFRLWFSPLHFIRKKGVVLPQNMQIGHFQKKNNYLFLLMCERSVLNCFLRYMFLNLLFSFYDVAQDNSL